MSFKKAWFQLHWILGITAGLILMVVGVTGATLSFEKEILKVLNPDLVKVTPAKDAVALTPEALLQRIQQNHPDRKINGLTLSKDPYEAAKVNFAVEGEGRRARKGETRYVDPYNGTVRWEEEFGHEFMHTVESLHRRLLSGEVGKQIVGASTIALIILILSGLYLRWPKTWTSLKTWLTFNPRKTGRSFLSSLHAVAGTWALIFLLLASLTGLYWSYDWYRAGLYQISGVPQPVRGGPPKGAKNTEMAQGERKRPGEERVSGKRERADVSPKQNFAEVAQVWQVFERQMGEHGYSTATLRLQKRQGNYEFFYLDAAPQHSRARNKLVLNADQMQVVSHERYADKPLNEQLMSSILPLHTGEYFGMIGRILMFVNALALPLFGITGILLYLDRRRSKKQRRDARKQAGLPAISVEQADTLIVYATQNGHAERLAWLSAQMLHSSGRTISVCNLQDLRGMQLNGKSLVLLIASTFGEGEAPDSTRRFAKAMKQTAEFDCAPDYAVLALGDRHYESFCAFGLQLDEWMRQSGAQALRPCITVDKLDPQAPPPPPPPPAGLA